MADTLRKLKKIVGENNLPNLMNLFDDCDKILKIYYDHFFKGELDENGKAVWKELPKFKKVCEQNLTTKDFGYIQAINHYLTSDGYLSSIVESDNKSQKKHFVTSKGFAFMLNGAYKQQIKSENEKIKLNRMNFYNGIIGWIVATIFGCLTFFESYQDDKKDDEIKVLRKEILRIQSKAENLYKKYQPDSIQQQKPKQKVLDKMPYKFQNK